MIISVLFIPQTASNRMAVLIYFAIYNYNYNNSYNNK